MEEEPRRRPPPPLPRLRVTMLLFWVGGLFLFFALLLALPALLEGVRSVPPGSGPLPPEELARARELARGAVQGWRLAFCFVAAVAAAALGAWYGVLPGFRDGRRGGRGAS
jgi:hypothetical protein